MSREAHVRFCERAVVRFRRATRLIALGEAHLRRILQAYAPYYNDLRTHRSLEASGHSHSSADCITTICEPEFFGAHRDSSCL
jgi:hypothetical protein